MALIWSRNKIWGGTFTTDVDVADGTNNASVVPASNFLGLVQGTETDPRNRSKWFSSVIGQLLRAVLHKEEDRAPGSNIGVSGTGIESTQTVYTTPEQLPEVGTVTDDMSKTITPDPISMFEVVPVVTDRKNKLFNVSFSTAGLNWLKARTWLESEIQSLINSSAVSEGGSYKTTNTITKSPTGGITLSSALGSSLAFTVPTDKAYTKGVRLRITDSSDINKFVEGEVVSFSAGVVIILVDRVEGTGSTGSTYQINLGGGPASIIKTAGSIYIGNTPNADPIFDITFASPLASVNYIVTGTLVSLGVDYNNDNDVIWMVRDKTVNGFKLVLREVSSATQDLRFEYICFPL